MGLIALTSASLVDGFFIGNYVGVTALAALNLIIPIMTILFGVGMMLSIGGSVRGGKYLGEGDVEAASAIFSKTLISLAIYGFIVISLGLVFEDQIFAGVGASQELFPMMGEYYRIIMPFFFAHFAMVALYFFIRLDGLPNLAATSLAVGAVNQRHARLLIHCSMRMGFDWRSIRDWHFTMHTFTSDAVLLFLAKTKIEIQFRAKKLERNFSGRL